MSELQVEDQDVREDRTQGTGLSLPKRALILLGVFLGLQVVFLLSSIGAAALPKDAVRENIESPANSAFMYYRDYKHKVLGSCVSFDNNSFLELFAYQDDFDGDAVKAAALDKIDRPSNDGASSTQYFRYWHGWQLPIFLLLSVGDFTFLSFALGVLAIGATAFFFWQLRYYLGWLSAAVFSLVAFFSTNILGNFMGDFILCLSLSAVVLCCAFALKAGRNPKRDIIWQDCICLSAAALFCFFDFFSIPPFAIAVTVFSAMVASGCLERSFKRSLGLFVRFSAIFLIGFILTWASKWAFAAVYLGVPLVFENVINEMGLWAVRPMANAEDDLSGRFPRLYAIVKSAWFVLNSGDPQRTVSWNVAGIAGVALFIVGIVLIVVAAMKEKKGSVRVQGGVWGLLLPALYIPAGTILLYHHVLYHAVVFGYKPWAFLLADVAAVGFYLCCTQKSRAKRQEAGADAHEAAAA